MFIVFGRDISLILRTREISLHKNNLPESSQTDHLLTCICYNMQTIVSILGFDNLIWKGNRVIKKQQTQQDNNGQPRGLAFGI